MSYRIGGKITFFLQSAFPLIWISALRGPHVCCMGPPYCMFSPRRPSGIHSMYQWHFHIKGQGYSRWSTLGQALGHWIILRAFLCPGQRSAELKDLKASHSSDLQRAFEWQGRPHLASDRNPSPHARQRLNLPKLCFPHVSASHQRLWWLPSPFRRKSESPPLHFHPVTVQILF